jgi:hypothetical protein
VAAKEALQREAAERIAHSRKVYKEEVGKELDYESKLVRKENREMNKVSCVCVCITLILLQIPHFTRCCPVPTHK